jgi:hypothetical protein
MVPPAGVMSPAQARAKLVLPAPFWPQTAWMRRGASESVTSASAVTSPKRMVSPAQARAERSENSVSLVLPDIRQNCVLNGTFSVPLMIACFAWLMEGQAARARAT